MKYLGVKHSCPCGRASASTRTYSLLPFFYSAPLLPLLSLLPVRTQATVLKDGLHPRTLERKIKRKINCLFLFFSFLVVVASRKNFGFQSPRSPRSPCSSSSPSSTSEVARRRRFFWPSSPSHSSKLYSSLGWLNSKVPKPFSPFTLWLIDVDGF
jgi:hypothetical protein